MSISSENRSLADVLARLDRLTNWERRPRGEMRVGLDPMLDLMDRLGNPHKSFRAIHVAGTKGKGSVSALTEAGLLRAGWRVGRYASPHVERVNERISLMGQMVSDERLADILAQVLDAYEAARDENTAGGDATWFDMLTAAAFLAFREAGLDWAIVEVGLGGRLDSTNIIFGEVAVVTNIELEHTEILGSTREAIAGEKVGILKPDAVLVTALPADDAAGRVVQARAEALGCSVLRAVPGPDATLAERNAELVGLILDHLGRRGERTRGEAGGEKPVGAWLLDDAGVRDHARLPGRMERHVFTTDDGAAVPIVLDGAHVPFNIEAVMHDLARVPDLAGPCIAVVALASDKDARGFLGVLARSAGITVLTHSPSVAGGYAAATLQEIAVSLGMNSKAVQDPNEAFRHAIRLAKEARGWVLVTGTLYLAGALRRHLTEV
jgi:dihydrofolate synthase/folylpolyglutamate synthase